MRKRRFVGAVSFVGVLTWWALATPAIAHPTIIANPAPVPVPAGETQGKTTLTWDAGADHPFAEIWLSVDDADPVKLFEMTGKTQGKGSLDVTVEIGKRHRYILTDNAVELATVEVRAGRVNAVGQLLDEVIASGYNGDPETAPFLYFEWPKKQGEFTLGKFGGTWMNAAAEYDMKAIEARRDGALIAHGFISIKATGEFDRFSVIQNKDMGIRMIRHLSGAFKGQTQEVATFPPERQQDGGSYYSNMSGSPRDYKIIRPTGPVAAWRTLLCALIIPGGP